MALFTLLRERARQKPVLYGATAAAILNIAVIFLGAPVAVTEPVGVMVLVGVVVGFFMKDIK